AAHVEAVEWTRAHPDEARRVVEVALDKWVKKKLPPKVMEQAWARVEVTWDPMTAALARQLADGRSLGYLTTDGDIGGLVDRSLLDSVTQPVKPSPAAN